jgi:ketosteroid isomerase-like protein
MSSMLPSNIPEFDTAKPPVRQPRERGPIGGIIITVILAIALIAIIAVAVTRLSSGGLSRPTAATSPAQATTAPAQATAAAGAPADAATQQAIQQVIQQVNSAQVDAVHSNDPSGMQGTATQQFYQEQVSNNQDLVDNGVTDIKLVNIEWGPITVSGDTASATDFETWSTTFQDGTTEQSRDRNVYTLVRDNGTWKVSADDHPDQQAGNQTGGQGPGGPPAAP